MVTAQFEVEFRRDGAIHDEAQVARLREGLAPLTDLALISHGWNNDKDEAKKLYDDFVKSVEDIAGAGLVPGAAERRLGIVRVYWPSKKFADEDLIPGGGAASATRQNDGSLVRLLDELKKDPVLLGGKDEAPERRDPLERAKELVPALDSPGARREVVQCVRGILDPQHQHEDDGSAEFFSMEAEALFAGLAGPVNFSVAAGGGGATSLDQGGAASFAGDLLEGVRAGARRIANFATYHQMKARAGTVGGAGVADVLARVREQSPHLPLHLVGHSFGGRLVTAAASRLPSNSQRVTLTLLQAAFSHNGFAPRFDQKHDGAFRTVLAHRRVSGPVLVTHTKNDKAVGLAYPLASRIARDAAAALGDENDPYGGLGRNGVQRTPETAEADTLHPLNESYRFEPGRVFNLRADQFIKDHGDVTGHQVAYAFLHGVVAGG